MLSFPGVSRRLVSNSGGVVVLLNYYYQGVVVVVGLHDELDYEPSKSLFTMQSRCGGIIYQLITAKSGAGPVILQALCEKVP